MILVSCLYHNKALNDLGILDAKLFCLFSETGLTMFSWLAWNSLCRVGLYVCLRGAGVKGLYHPNQLRAFFSISELPGFPPTHTVLESVFLNDFAVFCNLSLNWNLLGTSS